MIKSIDYVQLGQRIRRLRHSLNITQDALAMDLGISPSFLGHLERGSRKASLDTLVALCNRLGVSPEYLLADSLDSDAFPSAKLSVRQMAALQEIFHVIEQTMLDWNSSSGDPNGGEEDMTDDQGVFYNEEDNRDDGLGYVETPEEMAKALRRE